MKTPTDGRHLRASFSAGVGKLSLVAGVALIVCVVSALTQADDINVTKVTAETSDSVVFQVSVAKARFRRGEDIPVNYVVTNKGDKNIYLVTDPTYTNVQVIDTTDLQISDPVVAPDPHEHFNYDFIQVRPRESYSGKLLIPAKIILSDKNYDFESAGIRVGFAYLFDISKLTHCKQTAYTVPCLTEVFDKARTLNAGTLMVRIPLK